MSFFFELSDVSGRVDIDASQFVLLICLLFVKLESESGFSVCVEVWNIEVELTTSERHDLGTVRFDEVSISGDFIFVKLLHALDKKKCTFVDCELELGLGRWDRLLKENEIDWVELEVVRLGSSKSEGPIDHLGI